MNIHWNKILIIIILVLVGIFSLLQNYIFSHGAILHICVGLAMLLLYKTKRKRWSLILGFYFLLFGIAKMFKYSIFPNLMGAIFFLVPGLIFFVLYIEKRKIMHLLLSLVLLFLGIRILF